MVRFDTAPGSVVFWQGTNFGSGWVTENSKWMSDQSWEIGGPHGCAEHMADKRGRFDHVRLSENTAARVAVHWGSDTVAQVTINGKANCSKQTTNGRRKNRISYSGV